MQLDRIHPERFFRLRSGEVVRVKAVAQKQIHGDLFDSDAQRWIPLAIPMPTWTLYAPCIDPTQGTRKDAPAQRWWHRQRRVS